MKVKALGEGNCGVARRRGKEAGVKAASPRIETGSQAGDADELAPHSEVPVSASQVKPGVVPRKSRPLPRETCPPRSAARERRGGTVTGNRHGARSGVSSGRSSACSHEPGVSAHPKWGALKAPEGLTSARRTKLMETTGPGRPYSRSGRPGGERPWSRRAGVRSGSPFTTRQRWQRRRRASHIGTARCGPARRVAWGPGAKHSRLPDSAFSPTILGFNFRCPRSWSLAVQQRARRD